MAAAERVREDTIYFLTAADGGPAGEGGESAHAGL